MSQVIQLMNDFTIYNINAYATSGISLVLNGVLIVVIIKKTLKDMFAYKNVLLQTCLVDIIFAIVTCLTVPQAETSDYRLFFRSSSPWLPSTGIFPCLGLWIYIWALLLLLWSTMIQALFRFYIIIRRRTPKSSKIWKIQGIIFFAAMIVSLPNLCVPCQNINSSDNDALLTMGLWEHYPQLHHSFRSVLYRNLPFILYTCIIFGLSVAANIVFFVLKWRVQRHLNSSKIFFSLQTMKIHKDFERKLMLQSIMPCFSILSLSAIFLYIFALPPDDANVQGGMLLVSFMPLQYIIVLNPLITLLSIKSYRNAIFCHSKKRSSSNGTEFVTFVRTSSPFIIIK